MGTTVVEVLIEAKALIADPSKRIVRMFACDAQGRGVDATSSSATCFCSVGAVRKATSYQPSRLTADNAVYSAAIDCLHQAARHKTGDKFTDIMVVNDCRPQDFVMSVWDEAIRLASTHTIEEIRDMKWS